MATGESISGRSSSRRETLAEAAHLLGLEPARLQRSTAGLPTARVGWAALRRFCGAPLDRAARRDRRLARLVAHVASEVPHYRERLASLGIDPGTIGGVSELARLPILERSELGEGGRRFVADAALAHGRLRWVRTSGSSGRALNVFFDDEEAATNVVLILAAFLRAGWRPWHTLAYLCVPTYARRTRVLARMGFFREVLIDLREGARANLTALRALPRPVIYGYPSQLSLIARLIEAEPGQPVAARLVVTNGEVLGAGARRRLERAFGCPVRDSYGSAEFQRVGIECEAGRLHLDSRSFVVETDPATRDDEGFEDLLITSLYQRTMPFLRYRIGDRARVGKGRCPCGRRGATLESIQGRCDDGLRLPGGRTLSPRAVSLLEEVPGILEFQLVQPAAARLVAHVSVDALFGKSEREHALAVLRRGVGDESVALELEVHETLARGASGKLRAVISHVESPGA